MTTYLKDLKYLSLKDRVIVGGKAASLGELFSINMNVPAGFVITTALYGQDLSQGLTDELLRKFDSLEVDRVAVRSSAIAEDASNASWAGQLETYLNVKRDGLIDAITECWDSVKSEHAKAYADQQNIAESERAVAVIVQAMIDSEIAGVTFTVNPVSRSAEQYVIEAVYGLGELLVQGTVTPETVIIDKRTGKVIERSVHRQRILLTYTDGKNTEVAVGEDKANDTILNETQTSLLVEAAGKIERHYKQPQDIEWAFVGDELFVLQARPITTL